MISISRTLRGAVALCTVLTAGLAVAQDGVFRMTDRAGHVPIQQTSFGRPADGCGAEGCGSQDCGAQAGTEGCQSAGPACGDMCGSGCGCNPCGCNPCQCGTGACGQGQCGSCYLQTDCNHIFAPCDINGMPAAWCQDCSCSPCQCGNGRRRDGRNGRANRDYENTLFAHSVDSGTGSKCRDMWHGHSMSFRNKNARLADKLFGWMIPAGCCGQGCPPVGKYSMVYADQPDYIDSRDTQMHAAQGYGMPMAVPLAPNVNHTYNYSSTLPSSRVTMIGNYNPQTSAQPLPCQSW